MKAHADVVGQPRQATAPPSPSWSAWRCSSRRRHARPGRDGHAVAALSARGTHPGRLDPHRADHLGAGSRPGHRWPACHRPVVALGVLGQRTHRGGGARLRRRLPPAAHPDPARALRPGRVPALGIGLGLLMYCLQAMRPAPLPASRYPAGPASGGARLAAGIDATGPQAARSSRRVRRSLRRWRDDEHEPRAPDGGRAHGLA